MKITTWEDFDIINMLQNSRPGSEEHKFFVWNLPLAELDESLPGCCINIRVSSLRQSEDDKVSLPEQLKLCWIKANEEGFQVRAIYCDVQTGADANRRGFQQLIKDGKQKNRKWDVIFTLVWDRIVRGMDPAADLDKLIKKFDVDIRGVQQHIDVNQLGLWAWFGSMEKENIARRTKTGRQGNAEKGLLPSGVPPFGHTVAPANNGKKTKIIIHTEEANAIRWVIDAYMAGTPRRTLCDYFNSRGLFKREGILWVPGMLADLFHQTSLKGEWKWGKDIIPVPPIISPDLWEMLQVKVEANKKSKSNEKRFESLSGILYCEACDAHMYFKHSEASCSYRTKKNGERVRYRYEKGFPCFYYSCDSYDKNVKRDCRPRPNVNEKIIMEQLWPFTIHLIRTPERALALLDQYLGSATMDANEVNSALANINAQLSELDEELKAYSKQSAKKQISEKIYEELAEDVAQRRVALLNEKERIMLQENSVMEATQVREDLIVWFKELGNIPLEQVTERNQQIQIIRGIFEKVYINAKNELKSYMLRVPAQMEEWEEEEVKNYTTQYNSPHSPRRLARYKELQQNCSTRDKKSGVTLGKVS